MKKSELKTGMLVETTTGRRGLVMLNSGCAGNSDLIVGNWDWEHHQWQKLSMYTENLKLNDPNTPNSNFVDDIIKVYGFPIDLGQECLLGGGSITLEGRPLLWSR